MRLLISLICLLSLNQLFGQTNVFRVYVDDIQTKGYMALVKSDNDKNMLVAFDSISAFVSDDKGSRIVDGLSQYMIERNKIINKLKIDEVKNLSDNSLFEVSSTRIKGQDQVEEIRLKLTESENQWDTKKLRLEIISFIWCCTNNGSKYSLESKQDCEELHNCGTCKGKPLEDL